jgi:hypothetical protein
MIYKAAGAVTKTFPKAAIAHKNTQIKGNPKAVCSGFWKPFFY